MLLALLLLIQDSAVREVRDLAYYEGADADPKKHKLDLYLPKTEKPFPMVLWIHGGGWSQGDRALYRTLGQRFAERGLGFAAASYRLSPAVKHPEHAKDCARAFAWLHANAAKHGGDPDRLFISGQSAGGHLTALLACDRKYLDELKVPEEVLKGAVPMSGVYRIPAVDEERKGVFARMFSQAFGSDEEACRDASPLTHIKNCKVPMLVMTESDDAAIRAQMKLFQGAAEKEGMKNVEFFDAENRNHITIVIKMAGSGDDPVRDRIVDFVTKRCRELDAKK